MNKSRIYTLSSIIIGYLLTNNLNYYEQNALGNWFMTIGQILEGNAAYEQLEYNNKSNININLSNKDKNDIENLLSEIQELLEQIKKEL